MSKKRIIEYQNATSKEKFMSNPTDSNPNGNAFRVFTKKLYEVYLADCPNRESVVWVFSKQGFVVLSKEDNTIVIRSRTDNHFTELEAMQASWTNLSNQVDSYSTYALFVTSDKKATLLANSDLNSIVWPEISPNQEKYKTPEEMWAILEDALATPLSTLSFDI